jgi:hypothetical protein
MQSAGKEKNDEVVEVKVTTQIYREIDDAAASSQRSFLEEKSRLDFVSCSEKNNHYSFGPKPRPTLRSSGREASRVGQRLARVSALHQ